MKRTRRRKTQTYKFLFPMCHKMRWGVLTQRVSDISSTNKLVHGNFPYARFLSGSDMQSWRPVSWRVLVKIKNVGSRN